jgi:hypothetical protein
MPGRETVASNMDELLRTAIEQKRLIELVYLEKRRIVQEFTDRPGGCYWLVGDGRL